MGLLQKDGVWIEDDAMWKDVSEFSSSVYVIAVGGDNKDFTFSGAISKIVAELVFSVGVFEALKGIRSIGTVKGDSVTKGEVSPDLVSDLKKLGDHRNDIMQYARNNAQKLVSSDPRLFMNWVVPFVEVAKRSTLNVDPGKLKEGLERGIWNAAEENLPKTPSA